MIKFYPVQSNEFSKALMTKSYMTWWQKLYWRRYE